jgi:hypothetical protein
VPEFGVYTTIDIVPESDLSFEGSSEYSLEVLYGDTAFLNMCDQLETSEHTCFYVDSAGLLTIDFKGSTLISTFVL